MNPIDLDHPGDLIVANHLATDSLVVRKPQFKRIACSDRRSEIAVIAPKVQLRTRAKRVASHFYSPPGHIFLRTYAPKGFEPKAGFELLHAQAHLSKQL
jgi:hypothetical protein